MVGDACDRVVFRFSVNRERFIGNLNKPLFQCRLEYVLHVLLYPV